MAEGSKGRRRKSTTTEKFEEAIAGGGEGAKEKYVLKLYVTGMTRRSQEALRNLDRICREYLHDNYELQVIDIYQQPTLASGDQIIAVPTLIKQLPLPLRRLIGDLSQEDRIILGLDLKPKSSPRRPKRKDDAGTS